MPGGEFIIEIKSNKSDFASLTAKDLESRLTDLFSLKASDSENSKDEAE